MSTRVQCVSKLLILPWCFLHESVFFRSLSFTIRIGGGSGCETADGGEDVVVEYQQLGSSSFTTIKTLLYDGNATCSFFTTWLQSNMNALRTGYTTPKPVVISLPLAALTAATVLRWRQLSHSGSDVDEWALDAIQISDTNSTSKSIFSESFDTVSTVPYV